MRTALVAATIIAGAALAGAVVFLFDAGEASPSRTATTAPSTTPAPSTVGVQTDDIVIVEVGEQVQAAPPNEALAVALSQLMDLAMLHPDDVGYTWLDPAKDELVLSAANETGRALLEEAGDEFGLPYRIREVAFSYGQLERIKHEATRLVNEGVSDADLIFETMPDHRDNRTLITISEMSQPLLEALARRFPAEALAVRVDPTGRFRDPRPDP